jgi:Peptidase M15
MQLTEHFADTELGVAGCDQRIIGNATYLCTELLEPIRAQFGVVDVHDGYRDPEHNKRVGGKQTSFHLFEDGKAAADINVVTASLQALFDWIRLLSGLPFDKVILERNATTGLAECVHLQIDANNAPRRLAYTGLTGDGKAYAPAQVH